VQQYHILKGLAREGREADGDACRGCLPTTANTPKRRKMYWHAGGVSGGLDRHRADGRILAVGGVCCC